MSRANPAWFEFKGRSSAELGVRLMDAHSFSRGELRGSQESVSGRDGCLWFGDGATEAFELKCACRAPASRLREISAWLRGAGQLRFSQEPDAMYDARAVRRIEYRRAVAGADPLYAFSATFCCQPFPRIWPEAQPLTFTRSGERLENPGTAASLPRVEVEGSGSFSLSIGLQTLRFVDVRDGIIVDSELGDAFSADGALLANDHVDGELFRIPPGTNYVNWRTGSALEEGGSPGSVRRVTIVPRWRNV